MRMLICMRLAAEAGMAVIRSRFTRGVVVDDCFLRY